MASWHQKFDDVLAKAEHYKALGQTSVHIDDEDPNTPWHKVEEITASGSYRLNGPCGFTCIARINGIEFRWSVDFEKREANGKGYSMFDTERLRMVAMKLSPDVRKKLADFMAAEVLPGLQKTTAEWRDALNRQLDSEDCVRGLIAFANE